MEKCTTTYRVLLQEARILFRHGYWDTARALADEAIKLMEPRFSRNNPKLADAYGLHARICYRQYRHSNRTAGKRYFELWKHSARREIEILSLGMDTQRLAQAKYDYGDALYRHGDLTGRIHIVAGLSMMSKLREDGFPGIWAMPSTLAT